MAKSITSLLLFISLQLFSQRSPNILWIVTDDHRTDALECYNRATTGKNESALGYVSSPNIDKLASEGVLFTHAYCNSPACGPSRGSMITGRYPHHTGHYAFELSHQNPDFVTPSFLQVLQSKGYETALFGKGDSYIYRWGPGMGYYDAGHYTHKMHFKHNLQKNDVGDLWNHVVPNGSEECAYMPDGSLLKYMIKKKKGEISEEDMAKREKVDMTYDVLRAYARSNKTLILGGVNPMPAEKTVDAMIVKEFMDYLKNENSAYTTSYGEKVQGANTHKPLLMNLGLHLPHTPVLPPAKYRDVFKKKHYKIPEFDEAELENMPPQIHKIFNNCNMSRMSKEDKLQAVQDYYAFCAHGDDLIGKAVESFKKYCARNKQEYLIIFTVGDHGWHLGEQGIEAKFGPWNKSTSGAIIMVSSDKKMVPAGLVQNQLIEYVDIAPTILSTCKIDIESDEFAYLDGKNLYGFLNNTKEQRDYVIGEINLVAGPRAYLRSHNFAFSMRTRPNKASLNKNVRWALDCDVEEAELLLYDLRTDPAETHNMATHEEYKALAAWFRNKLGNIVLGDGRVECDWSKPNTYALSNFAHGAHDGKLNIPENIIPNVN